MHLSNGPNCVRLKIYTTFGGKIKASVPLGIILKHVSNKLAVIMWTRLSLFRTGFIIRLLRGEKYSTLQEIRNSFINSSPIKFQGLYRPCS
jgi:hypothetical protein